MQYYTDPTSHRIFRTLKSVLSYLGTGEISKHAYLPRRNVIDMYSFDKCADLVIAFFGIVFVLFRLCNYLSEIFNIRKINVFGFWQFCFIYLGTLEK